MDFSASLLFCGFTFGVIGMWMFRQGKKRANITSMAIAITLMIYPYFISNTILAWSLGIVLCVIAYFRW